MYWLHSLLPDLPHYGYVLVFIITFLNSLGLPLPGEPTLFGAGFVLGKDAISLWKPMAAGTAACFLGGVIAFGVGRRLHPGRIEKIHWLHLKHKNIKWMENFFKRQGAKAVFIARFVVLLPPLIPNLLAGVARMRWGVFLFYNITGSVVYVAIYIALGYFFGKKWKALEAWCGPTTVYLVLGGVTLLVLGIIFRSALYQLYRRVVTHKK